MKKIIVLCSILLLLVPFAALAQVDFCEGNFDYDGDVDGTDASLFKSDYGRSVLSNPCPDDGPAPVAKTGQTSSYAAFDDGYFEKGVASPIPRFIDNGNGTVTDNLTGLIWLQNASCVGELMWRDALGACYYGLSFGAFGGCGLTDGSGASDWRLANYKELVSLLDLKYHHPALPPEHPFIDVMPEYWSSTPYAANTNYVLFVDIYDGRILHTYETDFKYIWCVRGGH